MILREVRYILYIQSESGFLYTRAKERNYSFASTTLLLRLHARRSYKWRQRKNQQQNL
jgi:hypothetical protein